MKTNINKIKVLLSVIEIGVESLRNKFKKNFYKTLELN